MPIRRLAVRALLAVSLIATLGCAQTANSTARTGKAGGGETVTEEPAGKAQRLKIGAWVPGASVEDLEEFEQLVGGHQDYYEFYLEWDNSLPVSLSRELLRRDTSPIITWEPKDRPLKAIAAGDHDEYIIAFAREAKDLPGDIYLRPMHEMNSDSYPWGDKNGNRPEDFVAAWKHIVTVFRSEGADNVLFVWSPNNRPENWDHYWPGDRYVDYNSIDGYNWGDNSVGGGWESFDEIFKPAYTAITKFSEKPVLITETSSNELGGDKAAWIRAAFRGVKSDYPGVAGIIWFNERKEADWRVNSSPEALAAFRAEMKALEKTSRR